METTKDNPWRKINLTEQARILKADPELAEKLKAEAEQAATAAAEEHKRTAQAEPQRIIPWGVLKSRRKNLVRRGV